MFVLNFYSPIFVDQLKRGRKTATIRLGNKSKKYRKGEVVLITVGFQHSPRERIFEAVIDSVDVKKVREETGLEAETVERLGDVKYWYVRGGERVMKIVAFFLFRYRSGSVENHDHEVEEALWIPLDEAPARLAYKGEREMAAAAISRVEEGR